MKNISFAWTTPALLAGHKTVTRREWTFDYAGRFRAGELLAAYDRQPRFQMLYVVRFELVEVSVR